MTRHLPSLDTKRNTLFSNNVSKSSPLRALALRELELTTSTWLTWLLTLYCTWVTGHEALCLECSLVLRIDLHKCTSNTQASCLALTGIATALEVDLNVVLTLYP